MASFTEFFTRLCSSTPIQSQTDLARHLHVNRSAVTQAKERGAVPERWVYKLARDFALDPSWLGGDNHCTPERNDPAMNLYHPIPQVQPRLSEEGELISLDTGQAYMPFAFHQLWLEDKGRRDNAVLLPVYGDGMSPIIMNGDRVLVDTQRTEIVSGSIYAVGIETSILIRRIERYPHNVRLFGTNPDYPPVDLSLGDPLVRILGKIVWVCRDIL
jgi:hypothetical protein